MEKATDNTGIKSSYEKVDFLYLMFSKRKLLIKFTLIFFILGVIVAFITPKSYNSSVIIIPQVSGNSSTTKKYSKIAALVGFNLGSDAPSSIYPNIYPLVLGSKSFQRELLKTPISIKNQEGQISLATYLKDIKKPSLIDGVKKYTIGLPALLLSKLESTVSYEGSQILDSTIVSISSEERKQMLFLDDNVKISYDEVEGVVEIIGIMPEAIASAQITQAAYKLLQRYIIDYSIEKTINQLDYLIKRLDDTEEVFYQKRTELSNFEERNRNVNSAYVSNKRDQLKFEFDLVYSLYSNLSNEYEVTNLQVKKDTPIFTIVKPVVVPRKETSPNKIAIILGFVIFGLFAGMAIVFCKLSMRYLKRYIRQKDVN